MREDQTSKPFRERRSIRDVGFQTPASRIDKVIPDVGRTVGDRSAHHRLSRTLNGLERHLQLRLSGRRRELFDRLTLPIAAEEVHPSVRAGRIALQDLLDETHRLDVEAPVDRRAEAQAGDGVGHRHLVGRLPLMFAANRGFRCRLLRRQVLLDGRADRRQLKTIFADPMQELDDIRDVER